MNLSLATSQPIALDLLLEGLRPFHKWLTTYPHDLSP